MDTISVKEAYQTKAYTRSNLTYAGGQVRDIKLNRGSGLYDLHTTIGIRTASEQANLYETERTNMIIVRSTNNDEQVEIAPEEALDLAAAMFRYWLDEFKKSRKDTDSLTEAEQEKFYHDRETIKRALSLLNENRGLEGALAGFGYGNSG